LPRHVHSSDAGAPFGTWEIDATGEVSVIPQAWTMWTPWSRWKRCMSPSGTADPPHVTSRSELRSVSWVSA
jgi:hypothetical protein